MSATTAVPYAELEPYVRGLVRRALGPDTEHDDAVQQVLCSVVRNAHQLRDPSALRPWVRTITISVVADLLRRRRGWRHLERSASSDRHGDLVRAVEMRDLLTRLEWMIARLPPREQAAFVQRYVEGRKLAEIARREGYSLPTARRRLLRAQRMMKSLATQMAS
jgi:RNA polymerase sigma-70 factor (ECF subfamily)